MGTGLSASRVAVVVLVTAALLASSTRADVVQPARTVVYVGGRLDLVLVHDPPAGAVVRSMTACSVRPPGQPPSTALEGEKKGRLALLGNLAEGRCGVRVQPVNQDDDGVWTLTATFDDQEISEAKATATVQEFSSGVVPDRPSVNEGAELHLRLSVLWKPGEPRNLSSCAVVLPSGRRLTLAPADLRDGSGDDPTYDKDRGGTLDDGWCGVRQAAVKERHRGRWILEATDKATGVVHRGKAEVNVWMPEMVVVPSAVVAEKGEVAVLRLELEAASASVRQWSGCQAVRPDGGVVQLAGTGPATTNVTVDSDVQYGGADPDDGLLRGLCAVRLGPLDQHLGGRWQLQAVTLLGSEARASATLTVRDPYRPSPAPVLAVMGSRDVPLACGSDEAVSCRLQEPSGELAAEFRGPCRHVVDRVRAKHNGTWTCTALLPGYLRAVSDTAVLTLAEPVHTEVSVEPSVGGVVLRCRLAGTKACARRPDFCRWDAPSGAPLLLKEGVLASARYRYVGYGLKACDCSMAVDGPLRPDDLGVWRCVIGFQNSRSRGGLVSVTRDSAGPAGRQARRGADGVETRPFRSPAAGVARRGAAMTVGCRAGRALSYCWLRTPAGERLVLDESWARDGVRYAGDGLELGECGVLVEHADADRHSGTWRCGMGLAGTEESALDLEVGVDMIVSDSLLVAERANVTAKSGGRAELACRSTLGEALQYCRFQRPDGVGLHLADDAPVVGILGSALSAGRYRYAGSGLHVGSCVLAIEDVADEDFGSWTCGAGLAGDVAGREQTAAVNLVPEQGLAEAAMVGICVGLLVLVTGVAGVLAYRRFGPHRRHPRHRRRRPSLDSDTNELRQDAQAVGSERPVARQTRSASRLASASLPPFMPSTRLSSRASRPSAIHLSALRDSSSPSPPGSPENESPVTSRKMQ